MIATRWFVALVAACAASTASLLIFLPPLQHILRPSLVSWACVWALVSSFPRLSDTWSFAKRSAIGAVVGAVPALALACLGPRFRFAALLLSYPLPFAYAMCDVSCRTPLGGVVLPQMAILLHYAVLAFGPTEPRESLTQVAQLVLAFVFGSASAVFSHALLTLAFRRRQSFCIFEVESSLRACIDLLVETLDGAGAYLASGRASRGEVRERLTQLHRALASYEASARAWQSEFLAARPSHEALGDVQSRLADAFATVAGLLESFEDGGDFQALLFGGVAGELEDLRLCLVSALRGIRAWTFGSGKEDLDRADVAERVYAADAASARLQAAVVAWRKRQLADARLAGSYHGAASEELVAATFACAALRRLSGIAAELSAALGDAGIPELVRLRPLSWGVCSRVLSDLRDFCADVVDPSKYFAALPADAILDDGEVPILRRARRVAKYPLRFSLTGHIASLLLVWLAREVPSAKPYTFWALLPCILCFLPTTGAALLKSARRAGGTIFGGVVALSCLYWNPQGMPAFLFIELFLITFAGKFLSTYKCIDYGGVTFGLTFHIVVLGQSDNNIRQSFQALEVPLWRIGMTVGGALFTMLCSLALLPNHATKSFEHRCAEAFLCTTEVCLVSSEALLVADAPARPSTEVAFSRKFSTDRDEEGLEPAAVAALVRSLRSSLAQRIGLLAEAEAERRVVPRVFRNLAGLEDALEMLCSLANATRCSGMAFVGEAGQGGRVAAAQRFVESAPKWGPELARSIAKLQEILRQSGFGLALRLRSVRARRTVLGCGQRKLRRALRDLRHSFGMVRLEALEAAEGAETAMGGEDLDALCIAIFGLCMFAARWAELAESLEASPQRGPLPIASPTPSGERCGDEPGRELSDPEMGRGAPVEFNERSCGLIGLQPAAPPETTYSFWRRWWPVRLPESDQSSNTSSSSEDSE